VREALRRGTAKSGATVQTVLNVVRFRETPPTFFRNSKVAQGTQKIVDAYGMARYQVLLPSTNSLRFRQPTPYTVNSHGWNVT